MPSHLRHHDVREQQFERLLAQPVIGGEPVVEGGDGIAGILQRLGQEAAHVVVVFGQQDFWIYQKGIVGHFSP